MSGKRAHRHSSEQSDDSDIEIIEPKKRRLVWWTLAEEKALLALAADEQLDWDDRAAAMAAQGFTKRTTSAMEDRWNRIKNRKLTAEQEEKMEERERKMAAKKAKKNSGPANGDKDAARPFTLEEEGALVAIHDNIIKKASQSPYGKPEYNWDRIEVAMAKLAAKTGKSARPRAVLQREMARLAGRKAELGRAQQRLKQVEQKVKDKDLRKKLGI